MSAHKLKTSTGVKENTRDIHTISVHKLKSVKTATRDNHNMSAHKLKTSTGVKKRGKFTQ